MLYNELFRVYYQTISNDIKDITIDQFIIITIYFNILTDAQ